MDERFSDRAAAGQALARRLAHLRGTGALVLALPRGGVPVAAEVARALDLPLDIILVRKVGLPGQRELALAALAGPDGQTLVVNRDVARLSDISAARIEELAAPERAELRRRHDLWIGSRAVPDPRGRHVILVDDGIATGATTRAAIQAVRAQGAARITLAVPVAPADTVADLAAQVDELICLVTPAPFWAVGAHYDHFDQVSDDEVRRTLDDLRARP